jgi:hypothetical protein
MSSLHVEISAQISVAASLFVPPTVTTFKRERWTKADAGSPYSWVSSKRFRSD